MRPHGIIYSSSSSSSGELKISLTEKEKKHFKLMQFIGSNLSSFALAFIIFFYGPQFELDLNYQAGLAQVEQVNHEVEAAPNESKVQEEFAISIPAIGASAKVIAHVNPYNEEEYSQALKEGIAHAKGTSLPGEGSRIYLFAHSTNSPLQFSEYNAVFYQLRLLNNGDRIFVNFNGESHLYRVKQKVAVEANDLHWMEDKSSEEELVLQTCDPPGTSIRRLLVIAVPAD